MANLRELLGEPRDVVDGFGVLIRRFRQVDPFSEGEVALVESHRAVELAIVDLVVGSRHPVLVVSHFGRVHFEPSVGCELSFVAAWNFPDCIKNVVPSYLADGLPSVWNSA